MVLCALRGGGVGVLPWAHSGYLKLDHPHRLLVLLQTGIIVIHNHSVDKHFLRTGTFCLLPLTDLVLGGRLWRG